MEHTIMSSLGNAGLGASLKFLTLKDEAGESALYLVVKDYLDGYVRKKLDLHSKPCEIVKFFVKNSESFISSNIENALYHLKEGRFMAEIETF